MKVAFDSRSTIRWAGVLTLLLCAACTRPAIADDPLDEAKNLLQRNNIGTTSRELIEFLSSHCPSEEQLKAIQVQIERLGHDDYQTRKAATETLRSFGPLAAASLREAFQSTDVEVALKARRLWREINSIDGSPLQYQLTMAALRLLGEGEYPEAVPVALRLIEVTDSQPLHDLATMVVWQSATKDHGDLFVAALESKSMAVKTVVIAAMDLARHDDTLSLLQGYLDSRQPALRLAAARGLIDRLPQESFSVLVSLLDEPNRRIRLQAAWLLNEAMPPTEEFQSELAAYEAQVARWKAVLADFNVKKLKLPLRWHRLRLDAYPLGYVEEFAENAAAIKDAYRDFQYQETLPIGASVSGGVLRLHGLVRGDADQRMILSAEKVIGEKTFTRPFRMTSRLSGEAGGEGGWHMGLSVGRLKFLFHPGYATGGFRVEDVTSRQFLVANQDMGFEPKVGAVHTVSITVEPGNGPDPHGFHFEMTTDQNQTYRYVYKCGSDTSGPLDSIGLVRSGRDGGAAVFDELAVDLGVDAEN